MKAVNKLCRIFALVLCVAALVLFFMPFATIVSDGNSGTAFTASQLAFGSKVDVSGYSVDMAKSSDILLCLLLTVLGIVGCGLTFKSKGARYFAPAVSLINAVYMLVVAVSVPNYYVDTRPLTSVTQVTYSVFVPFICVALFASAILGIVHLLLDDYITVKESKGGKLTIPKRVVRFLRDYKSEIKKIVWPGMRDVVKNTVVVLVMCLIIGAFIWLFDFGLGQLLQLILSTAA